MLEVSNALNTSGTLCNKVKDVTMNNQQGTKYKYYCFYIIDPQRLYARLVLIITCHV